MSGREILPSGLTGTVREISDSRQTFTLRTSDGPITKSEPTGSFTVVEVFAPVLAAIMAVPGCEPVSELTVSFCDWNAQPVVLIINNVIGNKMLVVSSRDLIIHYTSTTQVVLYQTLARS